jgi:hypothetical protein
MSLQTGDSRFLTWFGFLLALGPSKEIIGAEISRKKKT